jgi:hypothetical protein
MAAAAANTTTSIAALKEKLPPNKHLTSAQAHALRQEKALQAQQYKLYY